LVLVFVFSISFPNSSSFNLIGISTVQARCVQGQTGPQGGVGPMGPTGNLGATGVNGATGATGPLFMSIPFNEYHVSTLGNDLTGTGSIVAPFLTIQKAFNSIGSATSVSDFNNAATALNTVYVHPGRYIVSSNTLNVPTRQVTVLHIAGVQIIGNLSYVVQGAVATYAGNIQETKLIIRGADLRSASASTSYTPSLSFASSQQESSVIEGNIILAQSGGLSSINTLVLELINVGVTGNIRSYTPITPGTPYVPFFTRLLAVNSILIGNLLVDPASGPCTLYIKGSDGSNTQAWGGINGNVYLYALSHVSFLKAVVLSGVGSPVNTWFAVTFAMGQAHNFSAMTGAIYQVDDNSFVSYLHNVPYKGNEQFNLQDTLNSIVAGPTSIKINLNLPSPTTVIPNTISNNIGTMIFNNSGIGSNTGSKNISVTGVPMWLTSTGWKTYPGPIGATGLTGIQGISFTVDDSGVLSPSTIITIEANAKATSDHMWFYLVTVDERNSTWQNTPIPAGLLGDVSLNVITCQYIPLTQVYVFSNFGEFTGKTGGTGATGSQGIVGQTGATGPKGATGATGATGGTGADGIIGATGFAGGTGATGATGGTGPNGGTGAVGLVGATGTTGATGASGATSITSITSSEGTLIITSTTTTPTIATQQPLGATATVTFNTITATTHFVGHVSQDLPLTGGSFQGRLAVGTSSAPGSGRALDVVGSGSFFGTRITNNLVQSVATVSTSFTLLGGGVDSFMYVIDASSTVTITMPPANVVSGMGDTYIFRVSRSSSATCNLVPSPSSGNIFNFGSGTTTTIGIAIGRHVYVSSDSQNTWLVYFS